MEIRAIEGDQESVVNRAEGVEMTIAVQLVADGRHERK